MLRVEILSTRIRALLAGGETLDAFDEWFTRESWNVLLGDPPEVIRLVGGVELRLAEHSTGHLSDDALRRALAALIADRPGDP